MGTSELIIVGVVGVFLVILSVAVIWLVTRVTGAGNSYNQAVASLGGKLDAIQSQVASNLQGIQSQVAMNLQAETEQISGMTSTLQAVQKQVDSSLQSVSQQISTFGEVKETLGQVAAATNRVAELGKDITTLQGIFQAGLKRGGFGEILLENLLGQILPEKYFQMQYSFKDRERVDAAIFLGKGILPIDSKFPLEGYEAEGPSKAVFARNVKGRIDETAKYIRPDEGTFAFAMLYVPAENLYYDIISNPDLFSYSMQRRVIPVSPNSMFAYLQVVVYGLRGLEIEENARMILEKLGTLHLSLEKVDEQYEKLGTHLSNAQKTHAELGKRFDKVSAQLESLAAVTLGEADEATALPAPTGQEA